MFNYFINNRNELFHKICFRNYKCGNTSEMIIINIPQNTTTFLEGLSADFFEILATKDKVEIMDFAHNNEISVKDIEEFITELIQNNTLNDKTKKSSIIQQFTDIQQMDYIEFEDILHQYGYLYSVHLDITYSCNLRCVHCYHDFDEYVPRKEMSLQNIYQFIDDIYSLGALHVTLSGGEAFLRKDFWDIVNYISSKGMLITVFTNATLIDENTIKQISNTNIMKIGISLYSLDEKTHNTITKSESSFKKTMNSISLLKDADCNVEIKCVLLKYNFSGYKDLSRFCTKNNFSLILDTSMTPKLTGDTTPIHYGFTYEQMIEFSLDENFNYHAMNNNLIDFNSIPCSAGKVALYCNPSGDIYPCVSLRIYLGNYKEIKNIWKNSTILKDWQSVKVKDFSDCGKHDYCNFCIEICPAISQLENGDFKNSNSSNCTKAKARQEAYRKLIQ